MRALALWGLGAGAIGGVLALAVLSPPSQARESEAPAPVRLVRAKPTRYDRQHSPLSVAWRVKQGPSQNAGPIVLVAEVTRRWAIKAPIRVHVDVPKGVQVTRGSLDYEVAPGPMGTVAASELELRCSVLPDEPVRLTAGVQTAHYGARVSAEYRFGKTAVGKRPPIRWGSDFVSGGWNLGPSIRMSP
jgi:hypothetical protein